MYKSTLSAAEASARPISESRTQLPARRPVDGVRRGGADQGEILHGRLRFSHSEQVPLRRPSGSDIVRFGRPLCGARPVGQPGSGLPVYKVALHRHGAALRCAAAALGTVASIRRLWRPLRFPRCGLFGLREKAQPASSALTASPLARAPRIPSARLSGDNRPWSAERPPMPTQTRPHEVESGRPSPKGFVPCANG